MAILSFLCAAVPRTRSMPQDRFTTAGGPYSATPRVEDKEAPRTTPGNLRDGTACYLAVRTFSPGVGPQANDLLRPYGEAVAVTPGPYRLTFLTLA